MMTLIRFVVLANFFLIAFGVNYVPKCPTTKAEWVARAKYFHCKISENFTYHCIQTDNDQLIEVCIQREIVRPKIGGCPWVFHTSDGQAVFGAPLSECKNLHYCPRQNHSGYYTDELYKYPICLVPTGARKNFSNSNENTNESPKIVLVSDSSNAMVAGIGVAVSVPTIVIIILVAILKFRGNMDYSSMVERLRGVSERLLFRNEGGQSVLRRLESITFEDLVNGIIDGIKQNNMQKVGNYMQRLKWKRQILEDPEMKAIKLFISTTITSGDYIQFIILIDKLLYDLGNHCCISKVVYELEDKKGTFYAIIHAAEEDRKEIVGYLIEKTENDGLHLLRRKGWTVLHYAVVCGWTDIIETALAKDKNLLNALTDVDQSAFLIATSTGQEDIAFMLLDRGATVTHPIQHYIPVTSDCIDNNWMDIFKKILLKNKSHLNSSPDVNSVYIGLIIRHVISEYEERGIQFLKIVMDVFPHVLDNDAYFDGEDPISWAEKSKKEKAAAFIKSEFAKRH